MSDMDDDELGLASGEKDVIVLQSGVTLETHGTAFCAGENCVIHNPSNHPLRDAELVWKPPLMARVCVHNVLHPDPDSLAYVESRYAGRTGHTSLGQHTCDGCCSGNYVREPAMA